MKVLPASAKGYAVVIGVGVVAVVILYTFFKKEAQAVVEGVGGAVTGNNALTRGTPYEGAGVVGTLGAATNAATGGLLGRFGSWLGGAVFEATHSSVPLQSRKQATQDNFWQDSSGVFTP
jgi:hypothetical protein